MCPQHHSTYYTLAPSSTPSLSILLSFPLLLTLHSLGYQASRGSCKFPPPFFIIYCIVLAAGILTAIPCRWRLHLDFDTQRAALTRSQSSAAYLSCLTCHHDHCVLPTIVLTTGVLPPLVTLYCTASHSLTNILGRPLLAIMLAASYCTTSHLSCASHIKSNIYRRWSRRWMRCCARAGCPM